MGKSKTSWGFAIVDLLLSLTVTFLVLSMPTSDTPTPPSPKNNNMLVVTLEWPLAYDDDIDLWTSAPGDDPVGFSRSHGLHFDLVRDDLGLSGDPLSRNMEMQVSRDSPAGEYVINAVMYNSHDMHFPVPVHVIVNYGNYDTVLLQADALLTYNGQEATIIRFTLDKHGHVTDINTLPKQLYFPAGGHE